MPPIPPYARSLLTPRELDILLLFPKTNAQIARELYISRGAVKTNIHRLLRKFNLPSRHLLVEHTPQILASDAPLPKASLTCPHCGEVIAISIIES